MDDPQYKYINSAVFFYKKLSELNKTELDEFVNYIFYSTNIIKIECTNQSFAIKLFQVLNDRGLELSPSDIVKSYIIGKYEQMMKQENKSLTIIGRTLKTYQNNMDLKLMTL